MPAAAPSGNRRDRRRSGSCNGRKPLLWRRGIGFCSWRSPRRRCHRLMVLCHWKRAPAPPVSRPEGPVQAFESAGIRGWNLDSAGGLAERLRIPVSNRENPAERLVTLGGMLQTPPTSKLQPKSRRPKKTPCCRGQGARKAEAFLEETTHTAFEVLFALWWMAVVAVQYRHQPGWRQEFSDLSIADKSKTCRICTKILT